MTHAQPLPERIPGATFRATHATDPHPQHDGWQPTSGEPEQPHAAANAFNTPDREQQ